MEVHAIVNAENDPVVTEPHAREPTTILSGASRCIPDAPLEAAASAGAHSQTSLPLWAKVKTESLGHESEHDEAVAAPTPEYAPPGERKESPEAGEAAKAVVRKRRAPASATPQDSSAYAFGTTIPLQCTKCECDCGTVHIHFSSKRLKSSLKASCLTCVDRSMPWIDRVSTAIVSLYQAHQREDCARFFFSYAEIADWVSTNRAKIFTASPTDEEIRARIKWTLNRNDLFYCIPNYCALAKFSHRTHRLVLWGLSAQPQVALSSTCHCGWSFPTADDCAAHQQKCEDKTHDRMVRFEMPIHQNTNPQPYIGRRYLVRKGKDIIEGRFVGFQPLPASAHNKLWSMFILRDVPIPGAPDLVPCPPKGEVWAFRGDGGDSFNQRWAISPAKLPDDLRNDEVRWPKGARLTEADVASGSDVDVLGNSDEGGQRALT